MDFLDALNDPNLDLRRLNALRFFELVRLVDASGQGDPQTHETLHRYVTTAVCVNCDRPTEGPLFCSELCSQEASFVRYVRRTLADGRIAQSDIQQAIGVRLLMLTGDGYPEKARQLTKDARLTILHRDRGKCQLCGRPATEVDHIRGSSSDATNLRALCRSCNQRRAFDNASRITVASDPKAFARIQRQRRRLAERVATMRPLRLCDDEHGWPTTQKQLQAGRAFRAAK